MRTSHDIIDIVRDVAQLVARAAGGGEAASSSLVIPTKKLFTFICKVHCYYLILAKSIDFLYN